MVFCCDGGGRVTASQWWHITSKYQDWELRWERVWSLLGNTLLPVEHRTRRVHITIVPGCWGGSKVLMGSTLSSGVRRATKVTKVQPKGFSVNSFKVFFEMKRILV